MKKIVLILLFFFFAASVPVPAGTIKTMDKDELKTMLDSAELILLDVRRGPDWTSSEFKIKGANRLTEDEIDSAIKDYPKEQFLVFYCA
jgi:rhodanese-related sulfurtransferase